MTTALPLPGSHTAHPHATIPEMSAPKVFISYSHKDEVWKDRLVTHLGVLEKQGLLQTWDDQRIDAGEDWLAEIRRALDEAQVAVFLISADSLTSEFVSNEEIPRILERRSQDGLVVFPILVRDCLWPRVEWLANLQVRPKGGKPLRAFKGGRQDAELTKIAEEIFKLAQGKPEKIGHVVAAPTSTSVTTPSRLKVQWEERKPQEILDPYPHIHTNSLESTRGWYLVGASQRGRLHAHEGRFRDDAFAIGYEAGWHLTAVADGISTYRNSRVGSNEAVSAAIQEMARVFSSELPSSTLAKKALQSALMAAWDRLNNLSKVRVRDFTDFGTTLLLLAHHPGENLISVAQIGDGLVAAMLEDKTIYLLGQSQAAEYRGQTRLLTNHKREELTASVETHKLTPDLLLVMTDGIADDFYPPQEKLPFLIRALPSVLAAEEPESALLKLLHYERPGSFDDRTLVLLCQRKKLKPQGSSPGSAGEAVEV